MTSHHLAGLVWFISGMVLGAAGVFFARFDAAHTPGDRTRRTTLVYALRAIIGLVIIVLIAGFGIAQTQQMECYNRAFEQRDKAGAAAREDLKTWIKSERDMLETVTGAIPDQTGKARQLSPADRTRVVEVLRRHTTDSERYLNQLDRVSASNRNTYSPCA